MTLEPQRFPITGIGASAGGVEALEGLFKGISAKSGVGYVVVTHLNPDRESLLHEIIARYTPMPVQIAADGAPIEPDTVYVMPADALLSIDGGTLSLTKPAPGKRERKPIDIFFSALARDQGEYAVGIVLSGGDGDGTLGVKAIKEHGGLTLAQVADGHGPRHPSMPDSAISTGFVDFAVPVEEMGAKIAAFVRDLSEPDRLGSPRSDSVQAASDSLRREIYAILRSHVGHDFTGYKSKTFFRRVQRRMQVVQTQTAEAYVQRLREDHQEVRALFRDLLISVTNFFRDGESFKTLAEQVIPKLFEGRGADDTVRVWVPGCATGEEVFSIAMLMREHIETLTAAPKIQIFATDIDENALNIARAARYPEALLDGISPERRRRFFVLDGGSYVLNKDVRDLCIFSPHSVIRDPPFSRIDLVSCRNLLIYFGPDVQGQVIPTFHYALRTGGFLFLGSSENVSQFDDLFAPFDKKHRIFRSRERGVSSLRVPLNVGASRPSVLAHDRRLRAGAPPGVALRQSVETRVLERFAPAHVVVNADGDAIYYSPRTGKYLEQAAGLATRQLMAMARKGLRLDLRGALHEAMETGASVVRDGAVLEEGDSRLQMVSITVEPLRESPGEPPLYLVLFTDQGPSLTQEDAAARVQMVSDGTAAHLDRELRDTRERLQSLIEEYETALEELKSSNEELVSVNEELQSSNEEFEASKEELQSLNEELQTVNGELATKVDDLDNANADLHNLFESSQVATIFLDRNLVIRSFTPTAGQIFNILPTDKGRPITHLASFSEVPGLAEDVQGVFSREAAIERQSDTRSGGARYLVKLAPFRDAHDRAQGVVVSLVDITTIAQAEAQHRVLIDELNHRVKNMLTVVISIGEQTYRTTASAEAFKAAFFDRLHALARSHELLSRERWIEASIEDLVSQELSPFGMDRVSIEGPALRLEPAQALSVGMVMHELATNAGKYGALSNSNGRVQIGWSITGASNERLVTIRWRESDGPEIAKPERRGFGLKLIEREVQASLKGKANLDFAPTGVALEFSFPLARSSLWGPAADLIGRR
ncbi:chemotaxis protein CheB [soil metagenome]